MIFDDIYPHEKLKEFIQVYRIRHFIIPPGMIPHPKPYPALLEQCISFYPRGAEIREFINGNQIQIRPRAVISGQFTQRINRHSLYKEILIITAVFHPGALYRLTGIPFYELCNKDIDLEAIFPKEGLLVSEQLANTSKYDEIIIIIENFLWNLIGKTKIERRKFDNIFRVMMGNHQKYSLEWLASQACMCPRQFERETYQYVGINPKLFLKISRFTQSYRMHLHHPKMDWLTNAVNCGYYDYQHLVKDYKEFANANPNIFFEEEKNALERLLGLTNYSC